MIERKSVAVFINLYESSSAYANKTAECIFFFNELQSGILVRLLLPNFTVKRSRCVNTLLNRINYFSPTLIWNYRVGFALSLSLSLCLNVVCVVFFANDGFGWTHSFSHICRVDVKSWSLFTFSTKIVLFDDMCALSKCVVRSHFGRVRNRYLDKNFDSKAGSLLFIYIFIWLLVPISKLQCCVADV